MYIEYLKLKNFRNYSDLFVNFARNFNVIYGNNAQGKTNILEALFLCASGRSHRTSKDSELVRMGEEKYQVELEVVKERDKLLIEVQNSKEGRKNISINDIPLRKLGNLMGNLNAVIFSPEDLLIIKEGPSGRRKFIDITISQIKPSYFYDLQQYARILTQRNMLLKEIQQKKSLAETLDVWNVNLAMTGARIIKVRNDFIMKINRIAEKNHYMLTDEKEKFEIKYSPSINIKNFENVKAIENEFLQELERTKDRDIARSTTTIGPQRDDYEIFIDSMNIRLYGSQGQQRTAVLSLKMSEIDIMKEETEEYPVLLLDDVMSELDLKRQEFLIKNLKEVQTFITCTDTRYFKGGMGRETKYYNVIEGKIKVRNEI